MVRGGCFAPVPGNFFFSILALYSTYFHHIGFNT